MTTVTPTTAILRRSLVLAALCLATLQAFPAVAQQGPRRDGRETRQDPPPRPAPQPDRQREVRERELQRRETMPEEERRQLRRDIYDHGRDIYRDRRAPR